MSSTPIINCQTKETLSVESTQEWCPRKLWIFSRYGFRVPKTKLLSGGMNFEPVKCVKEDPLARYCEFSDHVLKMKFDPLFKCSKNELCSTFDFRCNHWFESGSKFIFRTFQKWIKVHFEHVIRKYTIPRKWINVHSACISSTWEGLLHTFYWIKIHTTGYLKSL